MKKTILTLFSILLITTLKSQDNKAIAHDFADMFCSCVNTSFAEIDDKTKDTFIKLLSMTEDEKEAFFSKMSDSERDKFISKANKFNEKKEEIEVCLDNFEKKYEDNFDFEPDDKFFKLVLDRLKSKKNCKFSYGLFSAGFMKQNLGKEKESPSDEEKLKAVQKDVKIKVDQYCDCMNNVFSGIDNEVKELFATSFSMSNQEFNDYLSKQDNSLKAKFYSQALTFEKEGRNEQMFACVNELKKVDENIDDEVLAKKLVETLFQQLEAQKKCQFAKKIFTSKK